MPQPAPKVSVIIPVYNTENFIAECLESVCGQTLENTEIICIDDGSTDNSVSVIEQFARKDKRIALIKQQNKGPGGARNTGIDAARGEYIYFVDSDDVIVPQTLEIFYRTAEAENADVVFSDIKGFTGAVPAASAPARPDLSSAEEDSETIRRFIPVYAGNKFYKAAVLKSVCYGDTPETRKPFIEHLLFEDVPFSACSVRFFKKAVKVHAGLYLYRVDNDSVTRSAFTEKKVKDYMEGVRIIADFYKNRFSAEHYAATVSDLYSQIFRKTCRAIIRDKSKDKSEKTALLRVLQEETTDFRRIYPELRIKKMKYRLLYTCLNRFSADANHRIFRTLIL